MNVHVRRIAARHRRDRLGRFIATCLTALFVGLCLGHANAQDAGTVVPLCGAPSFQLYSPGQTRPITVDVFGNLCSTGNSIGNGQGNAGFVTSASPVVIGATGTTSAVTATIPAAANRFSYLCGFTITILESTTALTSSPFTVTGSQQTLTFQGGPIAASASQIFQQSFSPCIPGSGLNTAISVATTANADAAAVDVNAWGFQQ